MTRFFLAASLLGVWSCALLDAQPFPDVSPATPGVTATGSPEPTKSEATVTAPVRKPPEPDAPRGPKESGTPGLLTYLLCASLFGAVGGVVYELIMLQGNIEFPHRPSADEVAQAYPYAIVGHLYDLGVVARVFIGSTAAIAALWLLKPKHPLEIELMAGSLIAGSAGIAVFRSLQDRLTAALAAKDAASAKAQAAQQAKVAQELDRNVTALVQELATASGAGVLVPGSGARISQDRMATITKLLGELQAYAPRQTL